MPAIHVPIVWFIYITLALSSPDSFELCNELLNSQMWHIIADKNLHDEFMCFHLPDSCPLSQAPSCQNHDKEDDELTDSASTRNLESPPVAAMLEAHTIQYRRKRREKASIVEFEVRRSCRIKGLHKGFKQTTCENIHYFTCSTVPPDMPSKIVKNISISFCKVADKESQEENLKKAKKNKTGPAAGKQNMKK